MAGPGLSEACRGRRMWITAQCSSTVLSRWLHLFWQALDCVWWWETAPGWCPAPALQLTMWIMETRRSKRMHQQTPTPINPSLKGSLKRPQTYLTAAHVHFKHWLEHDGGNGPKSSTVICLSILHFSCIHTLLFNGLPFQWDPNYGMCSIFYANSVRYASVVCGVVTNHWPFSFTCLLNHSSFTLAQQLLSDLAISHPLVTTTSNQFGNYPS